MTDIAQTGLKEPEIVDWDKAFSGSSYVPPPPALGVDGKYIVYQGVVVTAAETEPDEGYLNYILSPIKLVNSATHNGYEILFTRASTRPYQVTDKNTGLKVNKKGNPNKLAEFLRACGLTAKPQHNSEYAAALKLAVGKTFPFVLDWTAYNKDNDEKVNGFLSFPEDPERPGQRKTILKAGDFYTVRDNKGNVLETKQVVSDVLFANARLKYFRDPSKGQQK